MIYSFFYVTNFLISTIISKYIFFLFNGKFTILISFKYLRKTLLYSRARPLPTPVQPAVLSLLTPHRSFKIYKTPTVVLIKVLYLHSVKPIEKILIETGKTFYYNYSFIEN